MERKKGNFNKVQYNNEYNRGAYDRFSLMLPHGQKERIKAAADKTGESVNAFINRLISAELERIEAGGSGITDSDK